MVELYIVRHGETDTNYTGKINGSATDLALNETGRNQVNYLKEHLNINDFDEVYASPLKRAQETASILNQNVHDIKTDDRLREINYGAWDGLLADDVQAKYPQCFDEHNYLAANYSDYSKDAETFQSVLDRLHLFFADMTKKDNEKILVVCHGFLTRSLIQLVTKTPDVEGILEPANASVSKVVITKTGRTYLAYYNRMENL